MSAPTRPYCQATLNYATATGTCPTEVTIYNGRKVTTLNWQTNGFELQAHATRISDWDDADQIEAVHYEEMTALAMELTGCRKAIISGHISRNPQQAQVHGDYAPIEFVHSDFTDNYGTLIKQRYAQQLDFEMRALQRADTTIDELHNAQDLMILQFWRNVGPTQPDLPLAFCDAQTVPRTDLLAFNVPNYAGGDFAFDTFGVCAPAEPNRHCWYTYPNLDPAEVVVFRTFDSRCVTSGAPFWTPHAAFRDPVAAAAAPARRSIEVRATCLF